MGRLWEARLNSTLSAIQDYAYSVIGGYSDLDGGLRETVEELLGATLFGTAGRRPKRSCWLRAAAEAALHNVTKPHRPRTYRDAGGQRGLGVAGRSARQAEASTSRRHWPWTRME